MLAYHQSIYKLTSKMDRQHQVTAYGHLMFPQGFMRLCVDKHTLSPLKKTIAKW